MTVDDNAENGVFVNRLIEKIPELRPLVDEHIEYHEALLSHVLFGDMTRWLIDLYRRSRVTQRGEASSGPTGHIQGVHGGHSR